MKTLKILALVSLVACQTASVIAIIKNPEAFRETLAKVLSAGWSEETKQAVAQDIMRSKAHLS